MEKRTPNVQFERFGSDDELSETEKSLRRANQKYLTIMLAVLACVVALTIVFVIVATSNKNSKEKATPISSPNDPNKYRVLVLDNGLTVLLVSDPDTEVSAAAIDYGAGSFYDFFGSPRRGTAGLAHFHEHMLFMGSEEFPGEDDFNRALSLYEGQDNAYTASENTNFHYSCLNAGFRQVLDIWAAFYKNPALYVSSMNREMNAVNSEYEKDIPNDGWRQWTMMMKTMRPDHPFSQFSIGTIETLNTSTIHDDLVAWHNTFFSSHIAKLVLYSNEDLDSMTDLTTSVFADISQEKIDYPSVDSNVYTPKEKFKIYHLQPQTDSNELTLIWEIPSTLRNYKTPALEWIINAFDWSGQNGLEHTLSTLNLAISVSASNEGSRSADVLAVYITLTTHGLERIDDIMGHVLKFIGKLEADSTLQESWRFGNFVAFEKLRWQFYSKPGGDLYSYASDMAQHMHFKDASDVLYPSFSAPPERMKWDMNLLKSILSKLVAEDIVMIVTTNAHDYSNPKVEEYFNLHYTVQDIAEGKLALWETKKAQSTVDLPSKNPFKISDTSIYSSSQSTVYRIPSGWYKYQVDNQVPTTYFEAVLHNTFAFQSTREFVIGQVYLLVFNHYLRVQMTNAVEAGYSAFVSIEEEGIMISVDGYTSKLLEVSRMVVQLLAGKEIENVPEDLLENLKTQMRMSLESSISGSAYDQSKNEFYHLTNPRDYTYQQQLAVLDSVSKTDVQQFLEHIRSNTQHEYLIYGNVEEDYSKSFSSVFQGATYELSDIPQTYNLTRFRIPFGWNIRSIINQNEIDTNSVSDVYFEIGPTSNMRLKVMADIISSPLHQAAFDQLRSKETLGYIVTQYTSSFGGPIRYHRLVVVGEKSDATYFLERIRAFLTQYYEERVQTWSDEDFQALKDTAKTLYLRSDMSLAEKKDEYWSQISWTEYDWERRQKLAKAVDSITKVDMVNYYRDVFLGDSMTGQRVLAVQLFAQNRDVTTSSFEHNQVTAQFASTGEKIHHQIKARSE